jgi:RHS repeat-associated protein
VVTNTFDNGNRVTERQFSDTSSHTLSVTYTYSARNQLTASSRYSDSSATTLVGTSSYGYDDAGRVTSITHKDAATPTPNTLDSFNYTYDNAGRVATETSTLGPSRTYGYDAASQLTGDGTTNYTWDAEGNRVASGWTTATGNELTSDGTWNYSYDAEGNQTQKIIPGTGEQWNYYYDNANRLVKAEHKPTSTGSVDQRVTFRYDVFGNRIEKAVGVSSPTITHFAYDLNGNAWADLDGNNNNGLLMRRLYADAVDAVFARIGTGASSTAWYLDDKLGSIRDIASNSGSLIDHRDWDSLGKLTNETQPSNGDRYTWTSRETDAELNDQYNRARRYNPNTGRWEAQDPLGFDAGDSNLYRYVLNRPVSDIDPSGLQDTPGGPGDGLKVGGGKRAPSPYIDPVTGGNNFHNIKGDPALVDPRPKESMPRWDPAAVERFLKNPNLYTQLGPTDEWLSHQAWAEDLYDNYTLIEGAGGFVIGIGRGVVKRAVLPVLRISRSRYPQLAENIWHAQRAGHPRVLTHGGDQAANRSAALRGIPSIPGLQRDEYPFASSKEGGASAWVGHVPVSQHQAQGGLIASFIRDNDLKPGDKYVVLVTP